MNCTLIKMYSQVNKYRLRREHSEKIGRNDIRCWRERGGDLLHPLMHWSGYETATAHSRRRLLTFPFSGVTKEALSEWQVSSARLNMAVTHQLRCNTDTHWWRMMSTHKGMILVLNKCKLMTAQSMKLQEATTAVRQLEFSLTQLELQINEHLEAFQTLVPGKIPPRLIQFNALQDILKNGTLNIPQGYELIMGTQFNNMPWYVKHVKARCWLTYITICWSCIFH